MRWCSYMYARVGDRIKYTYYVVIPMHMWGDLRVGMRCPYIGIIVHVASLLCWGLAHAGARSTTLMYVHVASLLCWGFAHALVPAHVHVV